VFYLSIIGQLLRRHALAVLDNARYSVHAEITRLVVLPGVVRDEVKVIF
jgi:hypothetical protein